VLCAHAFLLRRGLLLGHPVPSGLLLTAAASTATSASHLARLLLRHLPPPLPLFSLSAALRALAPRVPFPALLSLFTPIRLDEVNWLCTAPVAAVGWHISLLLLLYV
jgi:hypothetical protein